MGLGTQERFFETRDYPLKQSSQLSQLYFLGSFDVATGPRGIRTKFVPGASGRGWPRFRIEASFRTIMNFPLTSSDYARPRGSTKGYRIRFLDVISWLGRNLSFAGHFPAKKTRLRKYQCLPNLRIQLPLQNKQLNKYCIFKYSKIRPIPACKKIHNRRTLCLLLHGLKLALDVGEKKRSRETPPYKTMFKHFYHARFIRSQCML